MKKEAKCYKCGKRISVHDYATTDICPECMSFIEVDKAIAALEEELASGEAMPREDAVPEPAAPGDAVEAPVAESGATEEPAAETEENKKECADDANISEKEFFAAPDRRAARSELGEARPLWWGDWEKVLKGTDDLSDFSRFDSVRECAESVISEMSEQEGYELFLAHYDKLEKAKKALTDRLEHAGSVTHENKSKVKGAMLSIWAVIVFAVFYVIVFTVDDFNSYNLSAFIIIPVIFFIVLIIFVILKVSSVKQKEKERMGRETVKNPFTEDFGDAPPVREGFLSPQEREKIENGIDDIDWLYRKLEQAYESVNDEMDV